MKIAIAIVVCIVASAAAATDFCKYPSQRIFDCSNRSRYTWLLPQANLEQGIRAVNDSNKRMKAAVGRLIKGERLTVAFIGARAWCS